MESDINKFKKVLNKMSQILVWCLFVFACITMILTIISVKKVDEYSGNGIMGYKFLIVKSDSMRPLFATGDLIVIKKVAVKDLKVGDTITFYAEHSDELVVTHKIVGTMEQNNLSYFITQGTNVDSPDEEPVHPQNVVGRYEFRISKLGYILNFLKQPLGYICMILLPCLILTSYYLYHFCRAYKAFKQEQVAIHNAQLEALEQERAKNRELAAEIERLKQELILGNDGGNAPLL